MTVALAAEQFAHAVLALRGAEEAVRRTKMLVADRARDLRREGIALPHAVVLRDGRCVTICQQVDLTLRDSSGRATEIPTALVGEATIAVGI